MYDKNALRALNWLQRLYAYINNGEEGVNPHVLYQLERSRRDYADGFSQFLISTSIGDDVSFKDIYEFKLTSSTDVSTGFNSLMVFIIKNDKDIRNSEEEITFFEKGRIYLLINENTIHVDKDHLSYAAVSLFEICTKILAATTDKDTDIYAEVYSIFLALMAMKSIFYLGDKSILDMMKDIHLARVYINELIEFLEPAVDAYMGIREDDDIVDKCINTVDLYHTLEAFAKKFDCNDPKLWGIIVKYFREVDAKKAEELTEVDSVDDDPYDDEVFEKEEEPD